MTPASGKGRPAGHYRSGHVERDERRGPDECGVELTVADNMRPDGSIELLLADADYRYGAGALRLRVEQIDRAGEVELDGDAWFPVRGTQLRANGAEVGAVQVLVRAARLRRDI